MATFSSPFVIDNDADHDSEAHPLLLEDGTWLLVYRTDPGTAGGHVGQTGYLVSRTSTDGTTWSAPATVYNSVYDDRNAAMGVLPSGRVVILLRRYNALTSTTVDYGRIYSDDNGATWSSYTTIDIGDSLVNFGPIRYAPDGRYYTIAYDQNRIELWYSADGITWPTNTRHLINDDHNCNESVATFVNSTTMVCFARHEIWGTTVPAGYYCFISTDSGVTWSAGVLVVLSSWWRSAPWVEYDHISDRVWLFGAERRGYIPGVQFGDANAPDSLMLVHSADRATFLADPNGASTWTTELSFTRPVPNAHMFYGYPAVSHTGIVAVCAFMETHIDGEGTNLEDAELYAFTIDGVDFGQECFATADGSHIDLSFAAVGAGSVVERRVAG